MPLVSCHFDMPFGQHLSRSALLSVERIVASTRQDTPSARERLGTWPWLLVGLHVRVVGVEKVVQHAVGLA